MVYWCLIEITVNKWALQYRSGPLAFLMSSTLTHRQARFFFPSEENTTQWIVNSCRCVWCDSFELKIDEFWNLTKGWPHTCTLIVYNSVGFSHIIRPRWKWKRLQWFLVTWLQSVWFAEEYLNFIRKYFLWQTIKLM